MIRLNTFSGLLILGTLLSMLTVVANERTIITSLNKSEECKQALEYKQGQDRRKKTCPETCQCGPDCSCVGCECGLPK